MAVVFSGYKGIEVDDIERRHDKSGREGKSGGKPSFPTCEFPRLEWFLMQVGWLLKRIQSGYCHRPD
jgi:hypothetical protein